MKSARSRLLPPRSGGRLGGGLLLALFIAIAPSRAGDEKARPDGLRLFVDKAQVVRVPLSEISLDAPAPAAAYPVSGVDSRDFGLQLTCQGKPVPYVVTDGGKLLCFWADGESDGPDPRGACYHLRRRAKAEKPTPRFGERPPIAAPTADIPTSTTGLFTIGPRERRELAEVPTLSASVVNPLGRPGGYFFHAGRGALTFDVVGLADGGATLFLGRAAQETEIIERFPGGRTSRRQGVTTEKAWSIRIGDTREFDAENGQVQVGFATASDVFKEGENRIALVPGKGANRVLVGDAKLSYARAAKLLDDGAIALKLVGPTKYEALPERALVLDVTSGDVLARDKQGRVQPAQANDVVVAFDPAAGGPSPRPPSAVERCGAHELPISAAWVAIGPRAALPALRALADHRKAQGLAPALVALEDIACAFGDGRETAEAVRDFLAGVKGLRFVLLVGDVEDGRRPREGFHVPTQYVDTFDNGATATDGLLAPKGVAVGRLPARTFEQVFSYVERVRLYETAFDQGPWRKRLAFVAGEGRFGPMVDGAIEALFQRAIDKRVPALYDVDLTYANPRSIYLYPPDKLSERITERIGEGCLILDYIGHGAPYRLDDLVWGDRRYPIFTRDDAAKIDAQGRPPIVVITACSTGSFDSREPCVAESLVLNPKGAIAAIAATRISHPFANAILSLELEQRLFANAEETPAAERPRLGERFRAALDALALGKDDPEQKTIESFSKPFLVEPGLPAQLIDDERKLFHLFGDPALAIAFPSQRAELAAPEKAEAGATIEISGKAPAAAGGRAILTLETGRAKPVHKVEPLPEDAPPSALDELRERISLTYARANDHVVARVETAVAADGAFHVTLALPAEATAGARLLKVYAWSTSGSSAGSVKVEVQASAQKAAETPRPKKTFH